MSTIKLSGKPAGVTHYSIYSGSANWYQLDKGVWYFWFNGAWCVLKSPGPQQNVIPIPDDAQESEVESIPAATSEERRRSKEREKACDQMFGIMLKVERPGNRSDMAEALYDAGYRKVEISGK